MKFKLKHPQHLLEEKENERYAKIEDYFDRSLPELVEYQYRIKLTPELKDILCELNASYSDIITMHTSTMEYIFNKDFGNSCGYKYECKYLYEQVNGIMDIVFVLTPTKILRH